MEKIRLLWEEEDDKDDISIYSRKVREELLEDDELSSVEEDFMQGYDEAL